MGYGLLQLAASGHEYVARLLLENGVATDVMSHTSESDGFSDEPPLYRAAWYGSFALVNLLLQYGACTEARRGSYDSLLVAACAAQPHDLQLVKLLLERGANVHHRHPQSCSIYMSALQAASGGKSLGTGSLLLEHGANVNEQISEGYRASALAMACWSPWSDLEMVQLLLERRADVNPQGGEFGNPLQAASAKGNLDIVRLLIEKGADVNIQSGQHGHPLQAACYEGSLDVVQLLLEKGADVNLLGGRFGNCLQAAICSTWYSWSVWENLEIVNVLLAHGADVDTPPGMYTVLLIEALIKDDHPPSGVETVGWNKGHGPAMVRTLLAAAASANTRGGTRGTLIASFDGVADELESWDLNTRVGIVHALFSAGVDETLLSIQTRRWVDHLPASAKVGASTESGSILHIGT